jgi:hypothetical protein
MHLGRGLASPFGLLPPFVIALAAIAWAATPARALDFHEGEGSGAHAGPRYHAEIDYFQSARIWSAFLDLNDVGQSTLKLQNVLDDRYGKNEDAFARISLGMHAIPLSESSYVFRRLAFTASGEAAAWGLIENPVISQIHFRAVALGSLAATLEGGNPARGLRTRLGVVGGFGTVRKTDLITPDLASPIDLEIGGLRMLGIDAGASFATPGGRGVRAGTAVDYQGSYFTSDFDGSFWAHRWKSQSFVQFGSLQSANSLSFAPHLIFGRHPFPVDFLPRVWDFLHSQSAPDGIASVLGYGAELGFTADKDSNLKLLGGIYGRYWGAQIAFERAAFGLRFGTWSQDMAPIAGARPERLWTLSAGFSF